MPGTFTIRIKAFFLTAIFSGNFLVVCDCSATAAGTSDMAGMHHCCCRQKARPSREKHDCPGMQAVKFNLMEKMAGASVHVNPAGVVVSTREYFVPAAADRETLWGNSSLYLPPHAPPDRLAFHHCYLI